MNREMGGVMMGRGVAGNSKKGNWEIRDIK